MASGMDSVTTIVAHAVAVALVPAMVLLLLLPSTAIARLVRRAARWWWWVEMPLATVALVLLVGLGYLALTWFDVAELSADGARSAGAVVGLLALPLGLYWWAFTAADAIVRALRAGWALVQRACRAREGTQQAGS